jgi:hypothetical protein
MSFVLQKTMRIHISLALALASACLVGCGGGPTLVKVSGTVTQDGKPYGGALVDFVPDPSNKAITGGSDVTGASGNYLAKSGGRTGVAPGKYTVKISKAPPQVASPGEGGVHAPTPENDPGQQGALAVAAGPGVEKKAADTGPTGSFPAVVPAEGAVLDFDVKTSK